MPADVSSSAWLEEIVARFEVAWQHDGRPHIEDYLPTQPELRRAALVELAHAELEFRVKAGEPARAEDYIKRFPEMAQDSTAAASLLGAEYALRRRARSSLKPGEGLPPFRSDANLLAARLLTLAAPPAGGSAVSTFPPPAADLTPIPPTTALEPPSAAQAEPGRYRALASHARGGLGEVLIAEDAQLGRRVALKRIQTRWQHDPEARRRFLLEAVVTGRLEHPGVVPVYSLTQAADGELCYAMRFVEGQTLQQAICRFHATPHPLELRQLLARFVAVCNAVGYAHSKGVLHRDLKPANILLGPYGETLVADWGLAKQRRTAEGAENAEEENEAGNSPLSSPAPSAVSASETLPGQVLGTPAYMAPEQAAGAWHKISAAADVYALGATLYCLLTGQAPFEVADARQVLARVQRGDFPPPRAVRPEVPRALEALCLKAMAQRPERRYGSALELAADVERWLADEPVHAYPEPLAARLRRQARRHPAALAATGALLLAGLVGLGLGLAAVHAEQQRTAEQRNLAQENATRAEASATVAREQEGKARAAAARAEAINKFLTEDLLAEASPEKNPQSKQVTVEELLDKAAVKVNQGFSSQPLVEASVRQTLANTYAALGRHAKGEPHARRALDLYRNANGSEALETLAAANDLALLLQDEGKVVEAELLFRQNLEARRRIQGPDHPDTLDLMHNLANLLRDGGKQAEAEPLLRQALEARRRLSGPDHLHTLAAVNGLALLLQDQGKLTEAEILFRQNVEARRRVQGRDHPDTLTAVNNLIQLLESQGKLAEAEPLCRQNLEGRRRVSGPDHTDTLTAVGLLASLLREQGKQAEALPLLRQNLEARRRVSGPDHPDTLSAMNSLARLLQSQGKLTEAEPLCRQCLEARSRVLGPDHADTLIAVNNLALLLRAQDKGAEAETLFRRNLLTKRRVLGPNHPSTLNGAHNLALLLKDQGKLAEAETLARETLSRGRQSLPADHQYLAASLTLLGELLNATGRPAEAEPLLREALEKCRKGLPAGHARIALVEGLLGACLAAQKRYGEAEPLLLVGYRGLQTTPGATAAQRGKARERLVQLYEAWGKPALASRWKAEGDREAEPATPKAP
jgi:tRNA A-37 threonylcarbamoyl transferase component Bud32